MSWDWSKEQEQQKITVEVSPNEETRVNSSASPSASTATQSVSNSSSSASLNSNSSLEELSDETPPRKYKSLADIYASCQFSLTVSDPMNYKEAAEKEVWKKARVEEMRSIEKNGTWEMVGLPNEKNTINLKRVLRTKFAPDGSIQKHKARLVAKGYAQQQGIDFEETFSLVARFETVRTILALAAELHGLFISLMSSQHFVMEMYKKRFM